MNEQQIEQALALAEQGEPDEALRMASNILNENPNEARALFIASYVFLQAERYGMAYNLLKQAAVLVPKRDQVWNNLGMCCMKMGLIEEARKHFNRALQINPKNYPSMNNLALIEVNECNPHKALEYVNKSLAIEPDQWDVKETSGYANLMLGNWADGWEGFEAMVGNSKQRTADPRKPVPYWGGQPTKGLLIKGEQGIGDEIAFASMISNDDGVVIRNALNVPITLECDRRLEGLFKRSFELRGTGIQVKGTRFDKSVDWDSDYDAWCLSGSLGWHLRTSDADFTGKPYLVADPLRKTQWKALLDGLSDKPKIGIAWTGGLKDTHGERRSLNLEQLLPILKLDATFISLQYKDPSAEIESLKQKHGIKVHHFPWATQTNDYDDTAALVDELDLVISVTTAAVDISGALGKECWVLVPSKPHWRMKLQGDKNVWYNSLKLYRQDKGWSSVIKTIANDLENKLNA
jgi:tetratricopeptide (TPR) repeat protein